MVLRLSPLASSGLPSSAGGLSLFQANGKNAGDNRANERRESDVMGPENECSDEYCGGDCVK